MQKHHFLIWIKKPFISTKHSQLQLIAKCTEMHQIKVMHFVCNAKMANELLRLRFITHYLLMLLKGIIQSHEFLFKQTCWFIFLFHQQAPLWVSNFKFSSAWCRPSLNSELGRSLFLGWHWTWVVWSRMYFPGCVQSCWPHECLHRRVTDNVSLSPLHSPPSALPFYSHLPSQLPMSRTSPKIPLVHFCLSEGLHVTSG